MLVAALVAFALPAAAAVIYASLRPLWAGPGHAPAGGLERTYRGIALRTVLFVLALQVLIVLSLLGADWLRPVAPRTVVVLFGLFLAAIGDALPRTRPNLLFGIRTARTLDDRQLWMRLHRTAGYIAVAAGAAIAIAGVLFSKEVIAWVVSTSALGGSAMLAIVYAASLPVVTTTPDVRARRRREMTWWAVRLLLAAAFFYVGFAKFPGEPRRMWVRLFDTIGFGQWFRIFTGFVEIAGALLLVVPRSVVPGAALLCAAMIGALAVHVFVIGVGPATLAVAILLALLIGVVLASRTRT
jgi:putative oxidoreductase